MRKRSKKKLLFDVLSGIDAAAKGGVQGYMAGKKYKADLESQKLKDLLTQAKIDALIEKGKEKDRKSTEQQEQSTNRYEYLSSNTQEPLNIFGMSFKNPLDAKDPQYDQYLREEAIHRLQSRGAKTNEKDIALEIKILKNELEKTSSSKKKESPKEQAEETPTKQSFQSLGNPMITSYQNIQNDSKAETETSDALKNVAGGTVGGIGRYFKDRLKLLGSNAAKDSVGMENSYAKEYFTKKAEDPKYRKKMEQQEAKEDPEFAEKLSQIKNPQQWVEFYTSHGKENISKYIDEKFFDPIANSYVENLNLDPDSKSYKAGSFVGESAAYMLEPPILPTKKLKAAGNLAKLSTKAAARAKNAAINAPLGFAEGVIYSNLDNPEGSLKDRLVAGGFGAAGKTLAGQITPKAAKKQQAFKDIKKEANFEDLKEIEKRAQILGGRATIPELVGSETYIDKIDSDPSVFNKSRQRKIKSNINQEAKKTQDRVPRSEEDVQDLYKNIRRELDKNIEGTVANKSEKMYGSLKDEHLGEDGLLKKSFIQDWINSIKEHESDIKGLPKSLKEGSGFGKPNNVEKLLKMSPDDPKSYRAFYINQLKDMPTVHDFLNYRLKIKNRLINPLPEEKEALEALMGNFDRMIEKQGEKAKKALQQAEQHYATTTGPLKSVSNKGEGIFKAQFEEASGGRPEVSKIWGKQGYGEELAFKNLSDIDKKRVIGSFALENQKDDALETLKATWEKLPTYIKNSKDPAIKDILQEIKAVRWSRKTATGLQTSTKSKIASREPIKAATLLVKLAGYAAGAVAAPKATLLAGATELLYKGGRAATKAYQRKQLGQKNLKYYLKPELLDDEIFKKQFTRNKPLRVALRTQKQKEEENNDN